jgi:cell division initiation protein
VPLTPEDVQAQTFKEKFKGYDVDEVDAFLERVMGALEELHAERDALRQQLAERAPAEPNELLAKTLMTAQRAADETVAAAQAEADQTLDAARSQAARLLDEAQQRIESERQSLDAESSRVARAAESLAAFRSEYRSRVKGVIADQLALLDRAGELPDVPQAVRDLATFGEARMAGDPVVEEEPESALESLTGMFEDREDDRHESFSEPVEDEWRAGGR